MSRQGQWSLKKSVGIYTGATLCTYTGCLPMHSAQGLQYNKYREKEMCSYIPPTFLPVTNYGTAWNYSLTCFFLVKAALQTPVLHSKAAQNRMREAGCSSQNTATKRKHYRIQISCVLKSKHQQWFINHIFWQVWCLGFLLMMFFLCLAYDRTLKKIQKS